MRESLTADSLKSFMRALAATAKTASRVYLVGGASAVLMGWRTSTIDLDLKFASIEDQIYRYPDLDGRAFRRAVENAVTQAREKLQGTA